MVSSKQKSNIKNPNRSARGNSLHSKNSDFYPNAHAHLLDGLRWLNQLLLAQVIRLRRANFYDSIKDFHGFFISDEEIDALLNAGVFENDSNPREKNPEQQISKLLDDAHYKRKEINRRVQKSLKSAIQLPLYRLGQCLKLREFELQALLICLAPLIDARYEKIYAYLQNDMTKKLASIDFVLDLLCNSMEERLQSFSYFEPQSTLRRFYLLEVLDDSATNAQQFLKLNPRIRSFVLGIQSIFPEIAHFINFRLPSGWDRVVIDREFKKRLQKLFKAQSIQPSGSPRVFNFYGPAGVGKKTIAQALCGDVGLTLAVVELKSLLKVPEHFQKHLRLILLEGLLHPCAIYFDRFDELVKSFGQDPQLAKDFVEELTEASGVVFLGSKTEIPCKFSNPLQSIPVEISRPDFKMQKRIWHINLDGKSEFQQSIDLDKVISRFDLTGEQIVNAVKSAQQRAIALDPDKPRISGVDITTSCRLQSQPNLAALAVKIDPKALWRDIVLPDEQKQQLREIAKQVEYRHLVFDEWGFENALSRGKGLSALFAGPSGTGKTMAAEVIASQLGLNLFKIDLSAVVSKYIGETEKNLERIFREAENSNAILFFDEADALLGKRSEVKDAHDRYANIEIAYLLQRMEEYSGMTILATNMKQNIDKAFSRRLRFIVEFPYPDEESRLQIWRGIFPQETPLTENADLNFMASRFKISGGNIRNISLSAAFLAAGNGHEIEMDHLLLATKREFQKMGKLWDNNDFGEYSKLIQND